MKSPPSTPGSIPRHFYSLDALRGLAALAVVFWHWQMLFFRGTELIQFNPERQPLYAWFKPLYTDGWRAVDLFFCLSGFIFFWLYAEKISTRKTSLVEFFALRFSRLYPLHFLTLLIVAAGQYFMLRRTGSFFVYPNNDWTHFGLQSVFASNWGPHRGYSFNGPIWSVSIEVLLYGLFFCACFLNLRRWWQLVIPIVGGYLLLKKGYHIPLGRGLLSFFLGGISYYAFTSVLRWRWPHWWLRGLGACTVLLWILIPLNTRHEFLQHIYSSSPWNGSLSLYGRDVVGMMIFTLSNYAFELVLFPLTIVTLALWETRRGTLGRRLAFLGQISYSSYLLHFPLQLAFAALALSFAIPNTVFYSPLALVLFYLILIPLSLCSYRYFERPSQSWIRAWALPRPAAAPQRASPETAMIGQ